MKEVAAEIASDYAHEHGGEVKKGSFAAQAQSAADKAAAAAARREVNPNKQSMHRK